MILRRKLYCSYHLIISILTLFKLCLSDILVFKEITNQTVEIFGDLPALFGPPIPIGGLKGYVVYASPPNACIPIAPPPPKVPNIRWPFIALVKRYNCSFVQKVLNAQAAGYHAVIVRNVGSNSIEVMGGDHDTELVNIPSVFIGQDDGIVIEDRYQYDSGYFIVITDDLPFNIQNYLLPFAITIGICFVLMLTFMLVKCIRDYRRSRRHRLSSRALKKLPVHKFKKGDPYDCCAICLEDYADNDKLRVLPCSHAYHTKCIDPWLTKNRRVCPVCKRKVIIGDEQPSDLETDSEDETAPLINSDGGTQGGTFNPQRENPFQEAEREAGRRRHNSRNDTRSQTRYHALDESSDDEEDHRNFHQITEDDEDSDVTEGVEEQIYLNHEENRAETITDEESVHVPVAPENEVGFETASGVPDHAKSDAKDCIV